MVDQTPNSNDPGERALEDTLRRGAGRHPLPPDVDARLRIRFDEVRAEHAATGSRRRPNVASTEGERAEETDTVVLRPASTGAGARPTSAWVRPLLAAAALVLVVGIAAVLASGRNDETKVGTDTVPAPTADVTPQPLYAPANMAEACAGFVEAAYGELDRAALLFVGSYDALPEGTRIETYGRLRDAMAVLLAVVEADPDVAPEVATPLRRALSENNRLLTTIETGGPDPQGVVSSIDLSFVTVDTALAVAGFGGCLG